MKLRERKAWVAAAVAVQLLALCVVLHQLPGPEWWGAARLVMIGALPVGLVALLLAPFYLANGRRTGWDLPIVAVLGGLTLFFELCLVLANSFVPTAYEPAGFLLLVVWIWALVLGGTLVARRQLPGPSRKVGPLQVWHLAGLFYLAAMAAAFVLTSWNPTLRHRTFSLRAEQVQFITQVRPGDPCELDVGWFKDGAEHRCWVRLWCADHRLYGGFKKGIMDCAVSPDGLDISGLDDYDDGDPKLKIDTARNVVRLAYDTDLEDRPALVAEMDLESGK